MTAHLSKDHNRMFRVIGFFVLGLLLINFSPLQSQVSDSFQLKVLTLNMRVDIAADSLNNWRYRRDSIASFIHTEAFDLIGSQEVLHSQLEDLLARLPGYDYLGVGRLDGQKRGEYSAIFYRRDRFTVIESGNFWLSETPEVPGSRSWDAACERIVTWGLLQDQSSGAKLAVFNTHFDHRGAIARRKSTDLLLHFIDQKTPQYPTILMGDFNCPPSSEPIKTILQHGRFQDARLLAQTVSGPLWSFHGFGKVPLEQRELIDFIFITAPFGVREYNNLFTTVGQTYYSDHNPVWVTLTYKSAQGLLKP